MNVKIIERAGKIIVGILAHVLGRIVSIYKSIADNSVTECDEILTVMVLCH